MHKTGWKNIDLPPNLKKAREEQERLHRQEAISEEIYSTKENYYLELYQTQGRRKW